MNKLLSEYFFYYFTISSLIRVFLIIVFNGQNPVTLGEKRVRFFVTIGIVLDIVNLLLIVVLNKYLSEVTINNFLYFSDNFKIIWSSFSIAFFTFCIGLIALVARFSSFYLHRDHHFYKFFALLYILQLAVCLLVLTSSSGSIFIGWELVGLSSILLIAFYEHRMTVLKNSLLILVIYKIADILFYTALISSIYFGKHLYTQIDNPTTEFMILIACLMKSSIYPWLWLPRAMEGPTPSSAIFYGGLATHIPMFIFLNLSLNHPFHNSSLTLFVIIYLLIASLFTNLMSKQATDAKSAISYASITQLGIIYIEILLGFYTLALVHGIINGLYHSFDFLKSPSLIYQRHHMEKYRKPLLTPLHSENKAIHTINRFLYHVTYHEFYLPRLINYGIELFLGLQNSRTRTRAVAHYFFISLSVFLAFETSIYFLLHIKLEVFDESLLLLGLAFNFIATLYKYRPIYFFIAILASTCTVFSILIEHIHKIHLALLWGYVLLFSFFILDLVTHGIKVYKPNNFTGRFYKSALMNIFILIIGISIIGIPGLSSYLIWERLEYELLPYYPNLITEGFFILALNTILFFKFYYTNYLGKKIPTIHYETIKRI